MERIQKTEEERWRERAKTKPKLRLYVQLKRKLELEPYLTTEDAVGRARITALRQGTNRLESRLDVAN